MDISLDELRPLLEHVPEAIFLEDTDGNILDVNEEACQMLGYEREELTNMSVEDLVPEGSPVFLPEQLDKLTEAERPVETVNVKKDGTKIPIELNGRFMDVGGKKIILASIRDVTARRNAKEQLKDAFQKLSSNRERYKGYFDKLGDAVFITKVAGEDHGKVLDVNSRATDQTGYSRDELLGMNIEEDLAVPDTVTIEYGKGDEKLARGETITFMEKKRRKDGSQYWTEVMVTPIDYEGQDASLSINRDITHRRVVEKQLQQYKMAVEGTDDLMAAIDKDYNYLFANEAYKSFHGIEDQNITDKNVVDILGEKDFYDEVKPHIDIGFQGQKIEYETSRKNREEGKRLLKITYYPLTSGEHIEGLVGVMQDITEQKKTEQALKEERERLKQLHGAVDILQQQNTEEDVLQTAVQVAERILNFEICSIDIAEGEYLVPKAISSQLEPDKSARFKIGEGIAGKTFQRGETIWGDDIRKQSGAKPTSNDFRSFISAPIGKIGVFQVIGREVGSFDERDVELTEILTGHLREEINRVRLEKELREQAIHDPLTGLYNRRYFNETLSKEVQKSERYGHYIAFLMIDVNRFKEINDRYSHQTGDKVLEEVANLLEENVRDADSVVRYGGDEFLIMMPETNGESRNTITRLRKNLAKWNKNSDLLDFDLTLAMGVSHWSPEDDRDVEEVLKEADRNMYGDKQR